MIGQRVAIIGVGVVGRATGLAMLLAGHSVIFYDTNRKSFKKLPKGTMGTLDWEYAYSNSDVLILCVPTPVGNGGECDLSAYDSVIELFVRSMQNIEGDRKTLVQKSTCPPGTANRVISAMVDELGLSRHEFGYIVSPEFLNAGTPIMDTVAPRKVVIGTEDDQDKKLAKRLFHWVPTNQHYYCNFAEAEFSKYANNLFHALLISMWNELQLIGDKFSDLSEGPDVDMDWVAQMTALEPGLESIYRVFGKAWGGNCLPKDTRAFRSFACNIGVAPRITEALIYVNDFMLATRGRQTKHWRELHNANTP